MTRKQTDRGPDRRDLSLGTEPDKGFTHPSLCTTYRTAHLDLDLLFPIFQSPALRMQASDKMSPRTMLFPCGPQGYKPLPSHTHRAPCCPIAQAWIPRALVGTVRETGEVTLV